MRTPRAEPTRTARVWSPFQSARIGVGGRFEEKAKVNHLPLGVRINRAMSLDLPVELGADPRVHDNHVQYLQSSDAGDVLLLGVVHDHPASRYRVRELSAAWDPDVLALEVAPLALPLFEQYAADGRDLPALGGEMSAAIAAAGDARLVGIDGVDATFLRALLRHTVAERPTTGTAYKLIKSVTSVYRHASICRLAAAVSEATGLRLEVDEPVTHDCSLADPPSVQAADEHSQLSRSLTLLRSAEPPEPVRLRDEIRDASMARRLTALRDEGDVLAVVGRGHLEPLAALVGDA